MPLIVTHPANDAYRNNWKATFGKVKPQCKCAAPGPGNGNSKCLAPTRAICGCVCHAGEPMPGGEYGPSDVG